LEFAIKNVSLKDGLWLEFGVYKGDTLNFIVSKSESIVHGFDAFEGNPEDWRREYGKGSFALEEIPTFPENVKIVKGWFSDSLPKFLERYHDPIAFAHIDCDLYSSTKTILNELKHRLINKSILVFDEFFNYPGWKNHEFRAFMEFVEDNNKKYEYIGYVYKHSQVALRIID
jgi:hypothetical protein